MTVKELIDFLQKQDPNIEIDGIDDSGYGHFGIPGNKHRKEYQGYKTRDGKLKIETVWVRVRE